MSPRMDGTLSEPTRVKRVGEYVLVSLDGEPFAFTLEQARELAKALVEAAKQ